MNVARSIKLPAIEPFIRFSFIVLIALLPGIFAGAQVKFTTISSSQEIGRSDYLQVEFVVENAKQIDELTPPDFQGFRIIQGPIQSSGMSIVNGNMSQYKALSFVLQPAKTGKFIIGGASAIVDGKRMQSNIIKVTVDASSSGSANNSTGNNSRQPGNPFLAPAWPDPSGPDPADIDREYIVKPGENIKDKIHKNLFVKVQVDRNTCYVGEPIVATYKLYSRLSSESRVTKRPSLNGFSVYDMVDPNLDVASVEKLNGKDFTVHIIRKTQLIPLQAGTIDLDPVEVENTVHFIRGEGHQAPRHSGNSLKDLFDQMTDDNTAGGEFEENITLDTKPLTITVKPLPDENKPAEYNGAVGNFSIQASLANRGIAAQDEATLHVVVKGAGNLPVISPPPIHWPSGLDAFEPAAKEDINKTSVPMSGTKTFDYVFTARTPGHYTIPSIHFPYFDPSSQSYKTAGTESLDLQVAPGVKKTRPAQPSLATPSPGPAVSLKKFIEQHLEWIFIVLILSLLAVFLWRQNLHLKKKEKELSEAATKKALEERSSGGQQAREDRGEGQQAREDRGEGRQDRGEDKLMPSSSYTPTGFIIDPLQEAKQLFDKGDYKGFYREVNRAIWKALGKKLDLRASELNKFNIARQLKVRGWDTEMTLSLENLLGECEMNLYTPDYDTYNMQLLQRQAESLLNKLA
jgi:BatD DUF11 like domain